MWTPSIHILRTNRTKHRHSWCDVTIFLIIMCVGKLSQNLYFNLIIYLGFLNVKGRSIYYQQNNWSSLIRKVILRFLFTKKYESESYVCLFDIVVRRKALTI